MKNNPLVIIGRAEAVDLPELGVLGVVAKVDTGADSSAIWVSQIEEKKDGLYCIFFGTGSPYYSGQTVQFKNYQITRVANSFGQKELRYKVKFNIRIKGKLVRATFTLSDRSQKTYPLLLGRRLLKNKFMVDVNRGEPLHYFEKMKGRRLKIELKNLSLNRKRP